MPCQNAPFPAPVANFYPSGFCFFTFASPSLHFKSKSQRAEFFLNALVFDNDQCEQMPAYLTCQLKYARFQRSEFPVFLPGVSSYG